MKVYGVSGLPGSGKSVISRIAKKEGIYTISMGNVIRKEAEKNNCSTGTMAVKLREKYGKNVVANRCVNEVYTHSKNNRHNKNNKVTVKKIYTTHSKNNKPQRYKKIEQDIYIIEGIRSPAEVTYFKKHFKNFKVIGIHSSPEKRFNRLKRRKRSDDSTDYIEFSRRDERELRFGIGDVIALSDYMLINDGPIQVFKNDIKALIANEIKLQNRSNNKNSGKQNRKYPKGQKKSKKYNKQRYNNKQQKR
ncbi:MAG: AAA family ATPase [Methanosphaera sp.]|nr:AAA family ATPase [Methanosphaera sp.]